MSEKTHETKVVGTVKALGVPDDDFDVRVSVEARGSEGECLGTLAAMAGAIMDKVPEMTAAHLENIGKPDEVKPALKVMGKQ